MGETGAGEGRGARGEGETALLQTGLLMVPGTSREKRNFLSEPFTVFRESFS